MKASTAAKRKHARANEVVLPPDLVPHPRAREMARRPRGRATHLSVAEIESRLWRVRPGTTIAETAMFADVAQQNCAGFPRALYVDELKRCKTCQRPFLFYANEQRFWFETLRIPVDVDCVACVPCRKRARRVQACFDRYALALHADRLDAKAMKAFVDDTLFLLEEGLVRNLARLGAIKNRAQRELAAYPRNAAPRAGARPRARGRRDAARGLAKPALGSLRERVAAHCR